MKNKSTKKRTILKTALVIIVTGGVLLFVLPSRCGNENAKTESPRPEDISFESGSSAWVEPEQIDNVAGKGGEGSAAPSPPAPRDTAVQDDGEAETSVIAATGTSEETDEIGILPEKSERDSGEESSALPAAVEADKTAEAIPVIGETVRGQPASIKAEETRAVTDKPANEAVTETIDKNKELFPKVITSKIDAVPPKTEVSTSGTKVPEAIIGKIETESPKVESAKNADFMPELSRESLKITVGTSKENAALDSKSVQCARTQGLTPFAPSKAAIHKSAKLSAPASPEIQKTTEIEIKEAEKSEAVIPESLPPEKETISDSGEPAQTNLAAPRQPERKDGTLSIGVLLEGNMATRQGWGAEAGFIVGYEVNQDLAFGIKGGYGNDFHGIDYFEGLLYGRYYLPFKKEEFGLFAQVGIGGISFMEERKKKDAAVSTVVIDISLGARFPFGDFYVEPYIRAGYPVFIGAGAVFGWRF